MPFATKFPEYAHLVALISERVCLQYTNDPYTNLKPGDKGTVVGVDDFGTLLVNWDNGSTLGLISEAGDRWVVISADKENND